MNESNIFSILHDNNNNNIDDGNKNNINNNNIVFLLLFIFYFDYLPSPNAAQRLAIKIPLGQMPAKESYTID